ncbi:hypothetical protein N9N67_11680 [Bacteriovoracaceae bacterium]|nr:hypothetical protein [Bacteriovoracaceae bacterium]
MKIILTISLLTLSNLSIANNYFCSAICIYEYLAHIDYQGNIIQQTTEIGEVNIRLSDSQLSDAIATLTNKCIPLTESFIKEAVSSNTYQKIESISISVKYETDGKLNRWIPNNFSCLSLK